MEDFDEAEEQNEEDLVELGDSFGNINLKVFKCFLLFRTIFKKPSTSSLKVQEELNTSATV